MYFTQPRTLPTPYWLLENRMATASPGTSRSYNCPLSGSVVMILNLLHIQYHNRSLLEA
jgi:hypothetical protein